MKAQRLDNLIYFPTQNQKSLNKSVRNKMILFGDSSEMVSYVQNILPESLPELGQIFVDVVAMHRDRGFTVYVVGDHADMPITFQSACLKSCLVGTAMFLCHYVPPAKDSGPKPLLGIVPRKIEPMREFDK